MKIQIGETWVEWENLDEGLSGEYDPDDPDDVNLLRFTVHREDGYENSYCTNLPANTPRRHLLLASEMLFEALEQPSPKRRLQELSWLNPKDFEGK